MSAILSGARSAERGPRPDPEAAEAPAPDCQGGHRRRNKNRPADVIAAESVPDAES
jgi:hypothetical protein